MRRALRLLHGVVKRAARLRHRHAPHHLPAHDDQHARQRQHRDRKAPDPHPQREPWKRRVREQTLRGGERVCGGVRKPVGGEQEVGRGGLAGVVARLGPELEEVEGREGGEEEGEAPERVWGPGNGEEEG